MPPVSEVRAHVLVADVMTVSERRAHVPMQGQVEVQVKALLVQVLFLMMVMMQVALSSLSLFTSPSIQTTMPQTRPGGA